MAYTYLFFKPKRLPLTADELSADCVESLTDVDAVKAALGSVLPTLQWKTSTWGSGESSDGNWVEFRIAPDGTLSMRCSLRADYRADVQRICDALHWVAVDERPFLFQPHQPAISTQRGD